MKPGTPGFVGERLTEAREARGLAKVDLAKLVGVTPQAIAAYEGGTFTPRPEVAAKISAQLNVPMGRFFRSEWRATKGHVYFRSRTAATKAARTAAGRLFDWMKEAVASLEEFVELPPVTFPETSEARGLANIDDDEIEAAAVRLRRAWNMGDGPIGNMVSLLENHGAFVSRFALGAAELDAFSEWHGEPPRPFVVLGADKESAARSRLDAAHELGHLCVHRSLSVADLSNLQNHGRLEGQAFRFGAAFLLPEVSFAAELVSPTLDRLVTLKARWKVSIGMMIKRIEHLGLLDKDGVTRLWINYSRRGWRQREPLDDQLPIEQPRLAPMIIRTIVEHTGESGQAIAERLQLAPVDLSDFFALPSSFFEDQSAMRPVVHLRPRPVPVPVATDGPVGGDGNLVPFGSGRVPNGDGERRR